MKDRVNYDKYGNPMWEECPICLTSVFECKHKNSKGVWNQIERRKQNFFDMRFRLSHSRYDKIWKIIDEMENY